MIRDGAMTSFFRRLSFDGVLTLVLLLVTLGIFWHGQLPRAENKALLCLVALLVTRVGRLELAVAARP